MRNFEKRLHAIQQRLVPSADDATYVFLSSVLQRDVIEHEEVVQILRENGHLKGGGICMITLLNLPKGLDAAETRAFLKEKGHLLCRRT